MAQSNTPIDPRSVQWDDAPAIDPAAVKWDDAPARDVPAERRSMLRGEVLSLLSPLRGVKDVIDTGAEYLARGYDKLAGTNEAGRVRQMNDAGKADFAGSTKGSLVAPAGRVIGNVIGTAPVGGALGLGAGAVGATRLGNSLASGGFSTGAAATPTLAGRAADMGLRMAGGAATGAASAGLVNPDDAVTGAIVGGLLPPALKIGAATGRGIGRVVHGPAVPEGTRGAVEAARNAGYVVPPAQARPSLMNRVLEGTAGKITTAQNASAKNQQITNALAKAAIGVDELTPEAIRGVRDNANAAYNQLAKVGAFQADDVFKTALQKAGGDKALPGIANRDVDGLVKSLSKQKRLDAQQTIESIKRLRFEGSANKGAPDPSKRALGAAQMKVAKALEDLIDRNLTASGAPGLLTSYRNARTTLAKVYDVEKALTGGGNVDARKLAAMLKKGRPLTGELKTIAEFGGQFPKAAQTPEVMGSLPQTSPIDMWGAGIASGLLGTPLAMGGALARPGARALALSPLVQNRLTAGVNGGLPLRDQVLLESLYRTAPVLPASPR